MSDPVLDVRPLGFPWRTSDPFLFCVHHDDAYPPGNDALGPASPLSGRTIGQDFEGRDGWRMYHGDVVPGFPQHPHRGFETITIVRRGFVDHSDSLGATARFGAGDVQWLTAGGGIVHAEMFPLVERGRPNPLELFQIWLNLPRKDKLVDPYFTMFWTAHIPRVRFGGAGAPTTEVTVVAGQLDGQEPPSPPPSSWASSPDSDVAIWCIRMEPGASWALPPAGQAEATRTLNVFRGGSLRVADRLVPSPAAATLRADQSVLLECGPEESEMLLLQGRPIGDPVVQHGPFVMNTRSEIQDAMIDYQRTRFGGWPWPSDGPVHDRDAGRFARHTDGRIERP